MKWGREQAAVNEAIFTGWKDGFQAAIDHLKMMQQAVDRDNQTWESAIATLNLSLMEMRK